MNYRSLDTFLAVKSDFSMRAKTIASSPKSAKRDAIEAECPKVSSCHPILGLIPNSLKMKS